ncbi:MAG TPA: hypothetical protein VM573_02170 [Actinomycetota bacterium]|jgi:quinol monooxygenase YgiN|nr:hypothetical protein [Actinomycetota bacterium]
MATLQIEHGVADFTRWKAAFDSDPADRRGSGVLRYGVQRRVDDPNYVVIDLEFAGTEEARAFLEKMRAIWARVQGMLTSEPRTRILEEVEAARLT